jgi:copper oxidase (laccase) domain-containing protein
VRVVATDAREGDVRPPAAPSPALVEVTGRDPWSWLRQEHGSRVLSVAAAGGHAGETGDALVTAAGGAFLAVFGADCALVAFGSPEGVAGVAHAGWRGVLAGVIEAAVAEMRLLGASDVRAWRGACVRPCCYEFGADDLAGAAAIAGAGVVARTLTGAPAFDLPAAVALAVAGAGAELSGEEPACTSCSGAFFSWRARRDRARQLVGVRSES